MGRIALIVIMFLLVGSVNGQTISLSLINDNSEVIPGTKITVVNIDPKQQFTYLTDQTGWVDISLQDSMCVDGKVTLRVSRLKYVSKLFTFSCNGSDSLFIQITLERNRYASYSGLTELTYDLGAISPTDSSKSYLIDLQLSYIKNTEIEISMIFLYAENEKEGYNLSIERANFVIKHLMNRGIDGDRLNVEIRASKRSLMHIIAF